MNIFTFGINHKTAPIEIREKFFLNPIQQDLLLSELKSDPSIVETFVLSTCNRTEIYLHTVSDFFIPEQLLKRIVDIKKITFEKSYMQYFYSHKQDLALRHLLSVTSGLDSLVLGEKQIIGQVKTAVDRAREKGMFGRYFNILTNIAIRTAKKAQTETQISYGGSSVSWAAITMAEKSLQTLEGKSILVIGAGKMGDLALTQLKNKGVKSIYLMNRTGQAAQELAEKYSAIAVSFMDIKEVLSEIDVCVCASSAPHYILDRNTIEKILTLRHNRPLILLDISMPRNIDPEISTLNNVSLYHIDDLKKVLDENMSKRENAVQLVEAMIDRQLVFFYEKLNRLQSDPKEKNSFESIETP